MEGNIEVGDYVRDCDGFIVKVNEIQDYKEDDDIWYEEKILKGTWKSMVVKHSPNIIDLIEVGDYVNGRYIWEKLKDGRLHTITGYLLEVKDIKSIVTKEQFARMEYRLED